MAEDDKYIQGLDSVRAISMMLVVMTHLHLVGAGWVTMQTFFVMSGFLITRILLRLRERHTLGGYLKIFYLRRTLRIFPVFYLVLLVLLVVALLVPGQELTRQQLPYAFLYVWNWFAITADGPLAHQLEHFWSLAVEEQFYLLWPLLVFFVRGRHFWKVVAGLVVAGPLIRLVEAYAWSAWGGDLRGAPSAIYQMSTTHLDAFATGALLCAIVRHPLAARLQPWHLLVAVLLAYGVGTLVSGPGIARSGPYHVPLSLGYPIHMADHWQFVWGYTVLNLLSAALLLLIMQGRLWPRLFSNPLLSRLGVITYGGYVIHLPLLHLAQPWIKSLQQATGSQFLGALIAAPVMIALTFVLAELSYRYFESRFLRLKDRHFNPQGGAVPPPTAAPTAPMRAAGG